jgi:hypothetical protein
VGEKGVAHAKFAIGWWIRNFCILGFDTMSFIFSLFDGDLNMVEQVAQRQCLDGLFSLPRFLAE